MRKNALIMLVLVMCAISNAAPKDVADFSGAWYTGDSVPDAATPVWDLGGNTAAISASGGMLHIDTLTGGYVSGAWYLPGAYGAEAAPLANRNYTQGDLTNPWNPEIVNTGYTVEMGFEMLDSAVGAYGLSLYIGEAYLGGMYDVQIFKDKITYSGGTEYFSGDLTGGMHTLRLARNAGLNSTPAALPTIDMYVDGAKVFTIESYVLGGQIYNSGPSQDYLYLGSLSGSANYDVLIDYIATDFTGAYAPVPEPASMTILAFGAIAALIRRKK